MAVPKRRQSKSRSRKRRTHQGLKIPAMSICPQCKEPKPPHRACGNCGTYRGISLAKEEKA